MTPYDIEVRLEALAQELVLATAETCSARRLWFVKDDAYRLARSRAFLEAEGTIDARKATVDLVCEVERREARAAECEWEACKMKFEQIKEQISALQTISRFTLAEFQMQTSGGQSATERGRRSSFPF